MDNGVERRVGRDGARRASRTCRSSRPARTSGSAARSTSSAARTAAPWIVAANADIALEPRRARRAARRGAGRSRRRARSRRGCVLPDGSTQHSVHPFPTLALTRRSSPARARLARRRLLPRGPLGPRPRAPRPVGGRRVPDGAPRGVGRGRRLRRAPLHVRRGPRPRLAPARGGLGDPLRAGRGGAATTSRRATSAAWGDERVDLWMDATYDWLRETHGDAYARRVAALNVAGARARARLNPRRRDFYAGWAARHARASAAAASSPSRTRSWCRGPRGRSASCWRARARGAPVRSGGIRSR